MTITQPATTAPTPRPRPNLKAPLQSLGFFLLGLGLLTLV